MKTSALILSAIALLALGAGVGLVVPQPGAKAYKPLEARLYAAEDACLTLQSRAEADEATITMLKTNVADLLSHEANELEFQIGQQLRYQKLSSESQGYTCLTTPQGWSLLISVKDVQPYLDGYKLKLNVGNPQSVTFVGCTLYLKWGETNGCSREIFTQFAPGAWTGTEVALAHTDAASMGALKVAVRLGKLSMPTQ